MTRYPPSDLSPIWVRVCKYYLFARYELSPSFFLLFYFPPIKCASCIEQIRWMDESHVHGWQTFFLYIVCALWKETRQRRWMILFKGVDVEET